MLKKGFFYFLIMLLMSIIYLNSCVKIPKQIGDWQIEVGPPGNEFYEIPEKSKPDNKPPSENLLKIVRAFAPSYTEVVKWELKKYGFYWIRAEALPEKYDFYLSPDGKINDMTYYNDSTNTREKGYDLLIKGSRKSIPINEIPKKALETIKVIYPNSEPTDIWIASTFAGERYVLVVEGVVFYIRKDGQIQSVRLINEGGLEENYPKNKDSKEVITELMAEAEKSLKGYQDRFNVDKQITRLINSQKDKKSAFRFIMIGDSRSNDDLWPRINEHITLLKPQPDFIINTGDIVPRGLVKEYHDYFVPPLMKFDIPYFVALGNHDCGYDYQAMEYRYLFGENSLNYYFDYYNYRFIMVDNASRVQPIEKTFKWLEQVLSTTPKDKKIIVSCHKPFANIEKWAYHSMKKKESEIFTNLMSKYQVKHVYLGHIHAYSTATLDGVEYTIAGGGGAGLHDRFGPQGNVNHYIICDVSADGTLKQQVVRFRKKE